MNSCPAYWSTFLCQSSDQRVPVLASDKDGLKTSGFDHGERLSLIGYDGASGGV